MKNQTVKMFEVTEDSKTLLLYPTADGVKYLEKVSRLKKVETHVAGKLVTAFKCDFPFPVIYWKIDCVKETNTLHFHFWMGEGNDLVSFDLYDIV